MARAFGFFSGDGRARSAFKGPEPGPDHRSIDLNHATALISLFGFLTGSAQDQHSMPDESRLCHR